MLSNKNEILLRWSEELRVSLGPDILAKITRDQMTAQGEDIFNAFIRIFSDEANTNNTDSSDPYNMLKDIRYSHTESEISPSETARFVLSFRDALLRSLWDSFDDPQLLRSEIIRVNHAADSLCFIVFEPRKADIPMRAREIISYGLELLPKLIQGLDIVREKTEDDTVKVVMTLQDIVRKSKEGSEEAEVMVAYFTGNTEEAEATFGTSYVERVIRENESVVAKTGAAFHALEQVNRELSDHLKIIVEKVKMIDKFVADIDEIADQSKMLAINAAIEAARAGDKGRRFSVVAHEVRNLADMSARSAANISEIAEESVGVVKSVQNHIDSKISGGTSEMKNAEKNLKEAFTRFRQFANNISDAIQTLTHRYHEITEGIESSAISLQFQDAVSQEISDIISSIGTFKARFENIYRVQEYAGDEVSLIKDDKTICYDKNDVYTPRIQRDIEDDVEFF
ncbi:methyl-accepting chemotaxis protein [Desulfococcaceae bacterium HSG8]|nr:methyl-accepting chemotaxis protein [Desulfococcaceae bacterium HSG8]